MHARTGQNLYGPLTIVRRAIKNIRHPPAMYEIPVFNCAYLNYQDCLFIQYQLLQCHLHPHYVLIILR